MAFTGWRAWRIFDWQEATIGAAAMGYVWEGPVLTIPPDDLAKLPTGAGYHVWRTGNLASDYLTEMTGHYASARHYGTLIFDQPESPKPKIAAHNGLGWAFGEVDCYGTVCEYEHGFRSSHVIVRSLQVAPEWDDAFLQRLSDRYQCPVTRWTPRAPEPSSSATGLEGFGEESAALLAKPKRWDRFGPYTKRMLKTCSFGTVACAVGGVLGWALDPRNHYAAVPFFVLGTFMLIGLIVNLTAYTDI